MTGCTKQVSYESRAPKLSDFRKPRVLCGALRHEVRTGVVAVVPHIVLPVGGKMLGLILAWVLFTRLDGHAYWVHSETCATVQGAPAGYRGGTLLQCGADHAIVTENVAQVIRRLRGDK